MDARHAPYPFQEEAARAVRDLDYAAIFHEQGLGKTKIAIDVMLYWLETRQVDTVLFVTKRGLVQNWVRELATHTFVRPKVLDQNHVNNHDVFNSPSRVMLTHFEVFRSGTASFGTVLEDTYSRRHRGRIGEDQEPCFRTNTQLS